MLEFGFIERIRTGPGKWGTNYKELKEIPIVWMFCDLKILFLNLNMLRLCLSGFMIVQWSLKQLNSPRKVLYFLSCRRGKNSVWKDAQWSFIYFCLLFILVQQYLLVLGRLAPVSRSINMFAGGGGSSVARVWFPGAGPMRGGGRGGQRPGARVSGGPGRKAKTPWGIQDFISGGSRILIRGGGGPPKKNVGLATLGMIVTTLYLNTQNTFQGNNASS